jgi:formiminoglutamate deiminase
MTGYFAERILLPGGEIANQVYLEIADGRFTQVLPQTRCHPGVKPKRVIPGLVLPGFANTHSHSFHRALRGHSQQVSPDGIPGSFWTWRQQMYSVAEQLTPDSYYALALATYREMVSVGYTCVGEFHYLHHQRDGHPYDNPNVMGQAIIAAATDAGIRLTLLDTCYLSSGFGAPAEGVQLRFSDQTVNGWLERWSALSERHDNVQLGAAIHSVRAVSPADLATLANHLTDCPLHIHVSEQATENEGCLAAYGQTPTQVLASAGLVRPSLTAVHATHLTKEDVEVLGQAKSYISVCPTTERDLGDGIGPSRQLAAAGAQLTLGSDSQAVIDPFAEMMALELNERLATRRRGHFAAAELLDIGGRVGHLGLGWPDAGEIAVGKRADLVVVDQASVRTAGTGGSLEMVAFAATGADVQRVMIDGRWVFDGDRDSITEAYRLWSAGERPR